MRIPLAWANTVQNKWRTLAATAGICFSILLIFMQVGFLAAAKKNASFLYEYFDFDLILIAKGYLSLPRALDIDPYRLIQMRYLPGIQAVAGLQVAKGEWRNPNTREEHSCLVVGVDRQVVPFIPAEVGQDLGQLNQPYTVWVDRQSQDRYGPRHIGGTALINGYPLAITGDYELGPGLMADGSAWVNDLTFSQLFGGRQGRVNLGLIKIAAGHRLQDVAETIRRAIPADVQILSKSDIIRREQRYFITVKPVGIMFQVGAMVGFLIGLVILYQVLSTEISSRLNEFATLKAIGFTEGSIYQVGIQQGLIFCLAGYVPACLLAHVLYRFVHAKAHLLMYMDLSRAVGVLVVTLFMCGVASFLALRKVKKANPADLF